MREPEPYFSRAWTRRRQWQGHNAKSNVRNVIAVAKRDGRTDLRIWATGRDAEGWLTYTEVPAAEWDEFFAEGEAKP